jgi:hypothetical protein
MELAVISDGLSGAGLAHVVGRALWEKALHDIRDGVGEDCVTQGDMIRSVKARLLERKDAEHRIGYKTSARAVVSVKEEDGLPELPFFDPLPE